MSDKKKQTTTPPPNLSQLEKVSKQRRPTKDGRTIVNEGYSSPKKTTDKK